MNVVLIMRERYWELHVIPYVAKIEFLIKTREIMYYSEIQFDLLFSIIIICGLQIPREPHRSTRVLQLTGRWQNGGIM